MILLMDMGTSNTRLFLYDGERVVDSGKGAFGAGSTLAESREYLTSHVKGLLCDILDRNGLAEADVSAVVASGMASSELGICEVPHLNAPANLSDLAKNVRKVTLPEITSIPFFVVPGVRVNEASGALRDMMRGEEVETFGICDLFGIRENAVLVLPGSHNKIIALDASHGIVDFTTSMSGEMMSALGNHTILRGSVSYDFTLDETALREGAAFAEANGFGAALFHTRVLDKRGDVSRDAVSSFFDGVILSSDASLIRKAAKGNQVYIGGRESLRHALAVLVGGDVHELPDEVSENAVSHGLALISKMIF